ncbi:DUF3617 domain-containing protein [Ramlibacter terrae]|uniref:DUF3617 domain-containing protein n=1 Tax=Ramlibacter terrae TaxID=2732511 RepID=A0ABX6P775_9BURK|nr:DUF3617 domain-containing protein [Ramlibacter terrae]
MNNPQMDQAMADMQKQMAAMPPAERKQMEEMMAKQGVRMAAPAAGGGMTVQVCMTQEMVARNDVPMQEGCRVTNQQRTGNTTKMAFACANPPSTGEGQFTFAGPEAYSSRMTVKTTLQGKAETMTMEGSGKWVQADCGTVKPMGSAAPKK